MLQLKAPDRRGQTIDLGHGAEMVVRVATSIDYDTAVQEQITILRRMLEGDDFARVYALPLTREALAADEAAKRGYQEHVTNVELALIVTADVRNVMLPDGRPGGVDRETLALLMLDPVIRGRFRAVALAELYEAAAEGNGSGPSRAGGPAGESPIATPAATTASAAPTGSAAPAANTAPSTSTVQ